MTRSLLLPLLVPLVVVSLRAQVLSGKVLDNASGSPLPSANVRIFRTGDTLLTADLETDRDGSFQATLAAGEYQIEAIRTGFASVKLSANLSTQNASIVARLIKRGAIGGRVRDSQDKAISGAAIFVLPKPPGSEPIRPPGRATLSANSDLAGNYRIHNIPPGEYFVVVTYGASARTMGSLGAANTLASVGSGFSFYPTNSRPDALRINGGEEFRNIDFTLLPSALFSVSGKVDPRAENSYFTLALLSADRPGLATAVATSNPDGTFSFSGIPAGSYRLVVASSSRARNAFGFMLPNDPVFGFTAVNVAGDNLEGIVISPDSTRTLTVGLSASAGCPGSAELAFEPLDEWGSVLTRTVALKAGESATVKGLAPARYSITSAASSAKCYLDFERILDLGAGAPSSLDLVLAPAATIRGKLNTSGRPASSFQVMIAPESDANSIQTVTPDAQSRFSLTGLKPGRYLLAPFQTGEALPKITDAFAVEIRGGSVAEVELTAPEEKR